MKALFKLLGTIALVAVITLSIATCDNGTTSKEGGSNPSGTTTNYTITFSSNGGSGTEPDSRTVPAGSSITLPGGSGLSKTGFKFGGWNTNASGTGRNYNAGSSYTVTGNVTLYAKWDNEVSTYTVTFNDNGATSGTEPDSRTVQAGSSITLPGGNGLSKTGFTFGGWNTNATGTGRNYNAGSSYTVTGDVTLYAKWDNEGFIYTVTFDDNGATSGTAPKAQTVVSAESPLKINITTTTGLVLMPSGNGLSKTGYLFGGWNENPSGMGTTYFTGKYAYAGNTNIVDSSVVLTLHDITFYALWIPTALSGTFTSTRTDTGGIIRSLTFYPGGTCTYTQTISRACSHNVKV